MRYPKIFSISTVGVRRHNNQDYLLHHERTDFTGSNGVGKSIIADLLQLVFITDRELIAFGTEGIKSKSRQPHTLPYNTNECYAFLNIEIEDDKFVCIGVCVPNQVSRRIIPFVITRTADLSADLNLNIYSKNEILTSKSFLINDTIIPTLPELSKHIRNNTGLFLTHFGTKEAKQDYYRFLYSRKILPINLCIEENLEAFARTIQSFSKAKTLEIEDSESLKKFLFEDDAQEYENTFQKHRNDLNTVLSEFRDLEDQILDIEKKQNLLIRLKELDVEKEVKEKFFREAEYGWLCRAEKETKETYQQLNTKFQRDIDKNDVLKKKQPKFGQLLAKAKTNHEILVNDIQELKEYKQILSTKENIEFEIESLTVVEVPSIKDTIPKVDIKQFETQEILRRIKEVKPLFDDYNSINNIEKKVIDQLALFDQLKSDLELKVNELKKIEELLNLKSETSLFGQILLQGKQLSEAQEEILFSLIDVHWKRPNTVIDGSKYVNSFTILDEDNIQVDSSNSGYWLRSGELTIFIKKRGEKLLFNTPKNIEKFVNERTESIRIEIEKTQSVANELAKLRLKKEFDVNILKIPDLDSRLVDGTSLNNVIQSAGIILQLKEKISELGKKREEVYSQLLNIQTKVSISIDDADIDSLIESISNRELSAKKRVETLTTAFHNEDTDLKVFNSTSEQTKRIIGEKLSAYNTIKTQLENCSNNFLNDYGVLPKLNDELKYTEELKDNLDIAYTNARINYVSEYKAVSSLFMETKDNNDALIAHEITSERFGFTVLEISLLGPKIGHLDKITPYLQTANLERIKLMDVLYGTMIKVFSNTTSKYKQYEGTVKHLNTFFKGRKISQQYYFKVNFEPETLFNIEWLGKLKSSSRSVFKTGELQLGSSIERFVEDFFKETTGYTKSIHLSDLLNPKTYFKISLSLTDENGTEFTGSTGETYAAILLLGIGRLSKAQDEERPGIRFLILEETANLDNINFNIFPQIAEEFGFQLITMTPRPYGAESGKNWYLHHLIKGKDNKDVNYPVPSSYFKTSESREALSQYLKKL